LWPRRFDLFLAANLLYELKKRQGQVLSIPNLDDFLADSTVFSLKAKKI
jgi:hypothetical protein